MGTYIPEMVSVRSLLDSEQRPSSTRSSFDVAFLRMNNCRVTIFDEAPRISEFGSMNDLGGTGHVNKFVIP
jgi:hypothetical protein